MRRSVGCGWLLAVLGGLVLGGCPDPSLGDEEDKCVAAERCRKYVLFWPEEQMLDDVEMTWTEEGKPGANKTFHMRLYYEVKGAYDIKEFDTGEIGLFRIPRARVDQEKGQIVLSYSMVPACEECRPSSSPELQDAGQHFDIEVWRRIGPGQREKYTRSMQVRDLLPEGWFPGLPMEKEYDLVVRCPKDSCLNPGLIKTFLRIQTQLYYQSVDSVLAAEKRGEFTDEGVDKELKKLGFSRYLYPIGKLKVVARGPSEVKADVIDRHQAFFPDGTFISDAFSSSGTGEVVGKSVRRPNETEVIIGTNGQVNFFFQNGPVASTSASTPDGAGTVHTSSKGVKVTVYAGGGPASRGFDSAVIRFADGTVLKLPGEFSGESATIDYTSTTLSTSQP